MQLSLWPAGLSTNGAGTIAWAGGLIDWNAPDVQNAHYYYAMVKEVKVECYDPPSSAKKSGDKAYVYDDVSGTQDHVQITGNDTTLKSFQGSGLSPNAGDPALSASSAASSATDAPTVPGLSGAGTGSNGQRGGAGDAGSGSNGAQPLSASANAGSSQTAAGAAPTGSGFHGFSQGGSNSNAGATLHAQGEKGLQGSMLAVLLAIAGLLVL